MQQHFQSDTPAQRNLLCFINDSHSSATDFSEDPKITKRFDHGRSIERFDIFPNHGNVVLGRQILNDQERRKQFANFAFKIWVPLDILIHARSLPLTMSLDKFFGKIGNDFRFGRLRHFVFL